MNMFLSRFRGLLDETNKTQKEICDILGIRTQKLSNWKTGYSEPNFDDILMLADFFEVSTDYLLGLSENDTPAFKNSSAPTLPKDEKELLELYRQLPFESKQRLIARAEVMLEDTQEKKTKHGA